MLPMSCKRRFANQVFVYREAADLRAKERMVDIKTKRSELIKTLVVVSGLSHPCEDLKRIHIPFQLQAPRLAAVCREAIANTTEIIAEAILISRAGDVLKLDNLQANGDDSKAILTEAGTVKTTAEAFRGSSSLVRRCFLLDGDQSSISVKLRNSEDIVSLLGKVHTFCLRRLIY